MKKPLRILFYLVLFIAVFAGGFATFLEVRGIPKYDAPKITEEKVELTPERIATGTKIASMQCMVCHKGANGRLIGKNLTELPPEFGEIHSANITHSKEHGVGSWTDGELIYFLRTGIRRNGQLAPIYMPKFPHLSDEDIRSVVAWLRSDQPMLEADETPTVKPIPSLLIKFLCLVAPNFKPVPYPEHVAQPDTTDDRAYGKYLMTGRYDCYTCHSQDFKTLNMKEPDKTPGYCQGGNLMVTMEGNKIFTANITPDEKTGLGSWTEDDFVRAMHQSKNKAGKSLRYPMLPFTALTDHEVAAIWQYLRSIPAISNEVDRQWDKEL